MRGVDATRILSRTLKAVGEKTTSAFRHASPGVRDMLPQRLKVAYWTFFL